MRIVRLSGLAAIALAIAACGGKKEEAAEAPTAIAPAANEAEDALTPVTPVDYAQPSSWLCRPETQDACDVDASATVVAPDAKMTIEAFRADANAPIDCFYVYPTVSVDPTPNADIIPGDEEKRVALIQAARFSSACRIYAPLYRQTTLTALRALTSGEDSATNREMAYADIKAAWERYLADDNAGRGVVLIGHDQGAGVLTRLIASEIDGKPAYDKLVSAILLGTNVSVKPDASPGGSFNDIAPCASNEDVGCFISYAAYRAETPPPEGALMGAGLELGMKSACVNPAELDGSAGALKAYLPAVTGQAIELVAPAPAWTADAKPVTTPFVSAPGLLSARCVDAAGFSYLAITINGDPTDARTDVIAGDVVINGQAQPRWGLHLIDPNLALGNLVDIVKSQAKAYASREISHTQHPEGVLGHLPN